MLTSFFARFSSAVNSGSLGVVASAADVLGVAFSFFCFGLDDLLAGVSFPALGVELPLGVEGALNFSASLTFFVSLGWVAFGLC